MTAPHVKAKNRVSNRSNSKHEEALCTRVLQFKLPFSPRIAAMAELLGSSTDEPEDVGSIAAVAAAFRWKV